MARKKNPELHGFLIYGLIDPTTGQLRYVGKSSRGLSRPREHFAEHSMSKPYPSANWVKSLHKRGITPEIEVLERCESLECTVECEQFWIAYFKSIGCRLLNLTDGGDGTIGYKFSAESRAKMSATRTGKRLAQSTKEKLREIGKDPDNVEHCRKLAEKLRGTKKNREEVERAAAKRRGQKMSLEIREKFSKAHGGRPVVDQNGIIYPSAAIAAEQLGLQQSKIWLVANGKRNSTGGYVFKYADPQQG